MLKINDMDRKTRQLEKVESGLVVGKDGRDNTIVVAVPQNDGTIKQLSLFFSGYSEAEQGQTVIDFQRYANGYSQAFRTLGATPESIAEEVRQMVQAAEQ